MNTWFLSFFEGVIKSLGDLNTFITVPLGVQFTDITMEPFKSMSIIGLLGVGLVGTLGVLLAIHLVRLFVGG